MIPSRPARVEVADIENGTNSSPGLSQPGVSSPFDQRLASIGMNQAKYGAHGGRLARAVRADEPRDGTLGNFEAEVVHRTYRPETFAEVSDLDCRHFSSRETR
jgi:hypothetical protein